MSIFPRKSRGAAMIATVLLILLTAACREKTAPTATPENLPHPPGCPGCHQEVRLDPAHDLACTACHAGNPAGASQKQAHAGMLSHPAHPEQMQKSCGGCHPRQVADAAASLHFTLKNEVNTVRMAFGAKAPLASLKEIPAPEAITAPLALADDLLRRRCLACHLYSSGDGYLETVRGTGCAACHLPYGKGRMTGHAFNKSPADSQCLHCHYGNFVGADYHGRFEHDFNLEYRTPYRAETTATRPYGIEFHQLAPDIHQQAGMACIDCHSGAALMGRHGAATGGKSLAITCRACHEWRKGLPLPADNLGEEAGRLVLTTRITGKKLPIPRPLHPAHRQYGNKAQCVVCHSQWTFNDQGSHLLRVDNPEGEAWSRLAVQGSREVEEALSGAPGQDLSLRDQITGATRPGVWLKGYGLRRWENPLVGIGPDGKLHIFRPILDLHLSMIDRDKRVIFDNLGVTGRHRRYLPYTPHTTGKAGAFFLQRLKQNLPTERQP